MSVLCKKVNIWPYFPHALMDTIQDIHQDYCGR